MRAATAKNIDLCAAIALFRKATHILCLRLFTHANAIVFIVFILIAARTNDYILRIVVATTQNEDKGKIRDRPP